PRSRTATGTGSRPTSLSAVRGGSGDATSPGTPASRRATGSSEEALLPWQETTVATSAHTRTRDITRSTLLLVAWLRIVAIVRRTPGGVRIVPERLCADAVPPQQSVKALALDPGVGRGGRHIPAMSREHGLEVPTHG